MKLSTLTVDTAIEFLNELLRADPQAVSALIETRVPCNQELADHPTVQVRSYGLNGGYQVGLLGILNGLFGVDEEGWGPIAAQYDENDDTTVIGFVRSDAVQRGS